MQSIAIVGSGIAGMGCAHLLNAHSRLTIFEGNDYVGGHTNTIDVQGPDGSKVSFDTGFMVFNYVTYPTLTRLFAELRVPVKKTDMSFSVQYIPDNVEWNGAGLDRVFAQRLNIFKPRFWKMLHKLDWFNKNAPAHLALPEISSLTVADYVRKFALGEDFLNWYLVPMGAAVWSTAPERMLAFPVATLIRFFQNHGFLGLDTHYQWYTVDGGSRNYVSRLTKSFSSAIRLNEPVRSVVRHEREVEIITASGSHHFDKVILACHADETLALLANPSMREVELLSPFRYERNSIVVHTDISVMPRTAKAWASWNYRVDRGPVEAQPADSKAGTEAGSKAGAYKPTTHYWMNNLQHLSGPEQYFVSLNSEHLVRPEKIVRRLEYTHPLFDLATASAQEHLSELNAGGTDSGVYFCGSYFRYGFHEDALASAYQLCEQMLKQPAVRL